MRPKISISAAGDFLPQRRIPENYEGFNEVSALEKLECEEVEILLGNHPNHNCLIEKREYMISNPEVNPFINKNSWKIFLQSIKERCLDFEKRGY